MSIADRIIARITRRPPDVVIGGEDRPYLRRWWVIPRNRFFNIYLHQFLRSDDDRALHDHPWSNVSVLLRGAYREHSFTGLGNVQVRTIAAPAIRVRSSGKFAHRIELLREDWCGKPIGAEMPCWTLFFTGPRYRQWGFHCPRGWVHWKLFTAADDEGAIGKGCDA